MASIVYEVDVQETINQMIADGLFNEPLHARGVTDYINAHAKGCVVSEDIILLYLLILSDQGYLINRNGEGFENS